jgi:AraC-like DNA-binding protein
MGMSVQKHLRHVGIPITAVDDPTLFIPETPVWSLFDQGRSSSGKADFGFCVAQGSSVFELGVLGERMAEAVSLWDLLCSFIDAATDYSSDAEFFTVPHKETILFCRRGMPIEDGAWPVEQYTLWTMLDLCRLVLGSEWLPGTIWLKHGQPLQAQERQWLPDVDIYTGSPVTAFNIPRSLLTRCLLPLPTLPMEKETGARGILLQVKSAIDDCMSSGKYSLEQVAESLDLTPRTIQRQLATTGVTFRDLISRARYIQARELLAHSELVVTGIALDLGYADLPSFSRAFHHWAGISPTAYRSSIKGILPDLLLH